MLTKTAISVTQICLDRCTRLVVGKVSASCPARRGVALITSMTFDGNEIDNAVKTRHRLDV
jgi:hypothetical protein